MSLGCAHLPEVDGVASQAELWVGHVLVYVLCRDADVESEGVGGGGGLDISWLCQVEVYHVSN